MIIGPNFIFVHVPKTGGTWMRKAFEMGCVNTHQFHKESTHYPLGYLPDDKEHLPAYALVRNPWDWYVSHFFFVRQKIIPTYGWGWAQKQYVMMFRTLRSCIEELPPLQQEIADLTEHPRVETTLLRYEDGLIQAYETITGKNAINRVHAVRKLNTTAHDDYREYYDEHTRELVRKKNAALIAKHKYFF